MDISKIDANLAIKTDVDRENIVWMDAAQAPFVIYGAVQKKPYLRIPVDIAQKVSPGALVLCRHTAGKLLSEFPVPDAEYGLCKPWALRMRKGRGRDDRIPGRAIHVGIRVGL